MKAKKAGSTTRPILLGMFPLILTVLNRDYSTPYNNPYEGLLV